MGQVIVVDKPTLPESAQRYSFTGRYVDFLLDRFPQGFHGPHQTRVNGAVLHVEDYDKEIGEEDEVLLVIAPSGAAVGTLVVKALITAVVSTALNAIVQAFMPKPKNPSSLSASSPSPVYSLSVPTNQARLGSPIPVIYGRVLTVPDIASQPYVYYDNNDQYVCMLLCLGQGEHTIHQIQVADTPVDQMPAGVFQWWEFKPAQHGGQIGAIFTTTNIREDVDTSPEVSDQELIPVKIVYYTGTVNTASTFTVTSGGIDFPVGAQIQAVVNGAPLNLTITNIAGQVVTVSPASLPTAAAPYTQDVTNNVVGTYTLFPTARYLLTWFDSTPLIGAVGDAVVVETVTAAGTVTVSGVILTTGTRSFEMSVASVTGGALLEGAHALTSAKITVTPATGTNATIRFSAQSSSVIIGPYAACSPGRHCDHIQVDIVFPQGIFRTTDEGELYPDAVDLRFTLTPIDDAGTSIGADIVQDVHLWEGTNTPIRKTFGWDVPLARYKVTASRISPISPRAQDASMATWVGLKGHLATSGPAYGDTTIIACRVKATNGLASDAITRVGVLCSRNNISTCGQVFTDILLNSVYGGARPAVELDAVSVNTMTEPFNAVFDFKSTVWEALEMAAIRNFAKAIPIGREIGVIVDAPKTIASFAFAENDIAKGSLTARYSFVNVDDIDGYEIEYRDPVHFQPSYVRFPAASLKFESMALFGCTDAAAAATYAKRLWQRNLYRRKWIFFTTELQGHLPEIGDLISISHRLFGGTEQYIVTLVDPVEKMQVNVEGYRYDARVYL